jgi:hypothetical protein
MIPGPQWAGGLLLHAPWAASAPSPLADGSVPRVGHGGGVRAVPVGAMGVRTDAREVFGENPQRVDRDANATSRRGHRAWQGRGGVVAM